MQIGLSSAATLARNETIARSEYEAEEDLPFEKGGDADVISASAKMIGDIKTSADGQVGVVVAASVVGYVPPAGLMVQVELKKTEDTSPMAEEEARREKEAVGLRQEPGVAPAVRDPDDLSKREQADVRKLQARDAAVRQEEQAHAAAAGPLAGPIRLDYATGPDGRRYVIDGEVPIRSSGPTSDARTTARDGSRLAAAAMAAQAPSAADLAAAADGYRLADAAQRQQAAAFAAGRQPFSLQV